MMDLMFFGILYPNVHETVFLTPELNSVIDVLYR